jgi:hypothetical protein
MYRLVFQDGPYVLRLGQGARAIGRRLNGDGAEGRHISVEAASTMRREDPVDFGEAWLTGGADGLHGRGAHRSAAGAPAWLVRAGG